MIEELHEALLLAQHDRSQIARIASLAKTIPALDAAEVDQLLERLLDFEEELRQSPAVPDATSGFPMDQLLQPIIDQLTQREARRLADDGAEPWTEDRLDQVTRLYRAAPVASDLRNHLLRWLATHGATDRLQRWADLVCDDPPTHRLGIMLAFAPLMQTETPPSMAILRQLLVRATAHSQIAPAVYDLFNFYFREGRVTEHPAVERMAELTELLGHLCGRLGQIETGDLPAGANASDINQLVSDSVSLIVALCDTFAQLQYQPAAGKLQQALELRHRRVQTEAAAALARLGNEQGKATLIQLAQQPVARLRVLAYAEELGFRDDISLELQGEIAIAESHLAIWLAEPAQMGLAPSDIEFLESRDMYWPGYEHPVQCYLFRYSYGSGELAHSNIGICGPVTHAFAADLRHLEADDIYAAFAGWQTLHQEIFQVPIHQAESTFANEYRRRWGDLQAQGLDQVEPRTAASFFGQLVLVAEAMKDGQPGTAIVDEQQTHWYGQGNPQAPIDWQLAYSIWKGHQMLKSFNPHQS